MDLFRKIKKTTSAPCAEVEHDSGDEVASSNSCNSNNNEVVAVNDDKLNSIDDLLDSDEECAEIFDDDNEDDYPQTPSKAGSVSISSSISPKSFQEVVQSLGGGLSMPQDIDGSKHSPSKDEEESDSRRGDEEEEKGSDSAEDYTDDEDEGEDSYKPGGYHPVEIGEVYNQK